MKPLTLEALEVLDAIDRKGSFAGAAASLYKVQSKVSYTVRKLEEDLDVPLFRKEGRKSVLTPAGRVLLEQGRALLDATDRIIENTRQAASGWESTLTIAMDGVIPLSKVTPHLRALYTEQPNIRIGLYQEVMGGTWETLLEGRADLIMGAMEAPYATPGIDKAVFAEERWGFFVSTDHPLADLHHQKQRPISVQDTAFYRAAVARDSASNLPTQTVNVFEKQGQVVVSTLAEKVELQASGLAVGFLPYLIADAEVQAGRLIQLPHEAEPDSANSLYLAWRKDNKGRGLKWLKNHILNHYVHD